MAIPPGCGCDAPTFCPYRTFCPRGVAAHFRNFRNFRRVREAGAVISDWELWACATTVERQHCGDAPRFIAKRIEELALAGDDKGVEVWNAIASRLDQLRRGEGRAAS
jgi:hypothetical protein